VIENRMASIAEGNVGEIYIDHEDAVPFEKPKNRLSFRPGRSELFGFLRLPRPVQMFGSIAHGHTANRRCCPLGGRSDSLTSEWLRLTGRATRPRVSRATNAYRSSSLRRRDRSVNRRRRKPLGRTPPQRHPSWTTENRDFAPCRAQWVHGRLTVVVSERIVPFLTQDKLQWSHTNLCGRKLL
jgi:hypothetical protein